MNTKQIKDLHLLYDAVYDDNLREEVYEINKSITDEDIVEVATEYFYAYGLNDDGIDILIEDVGIDNFMEFVYYLSDDLVNLNEERSARKRKGGPSYEEVKAKIDAKEAAKKRAKSEAETKKKDESKKPESRGPENQAKSKQSKSNKPVRDAIAKRILGAVSAYKSGMERHKAATKTAGRLAGETAHTIGKVVSTAKEGGRRAAEHVKKHGLKSLANEDVDIFDYILEYLVSEGYADTNEDAVVIMSNMSEDWRKCILDEGYKRMNRGKIEKQAKRLGGARGEVLRNVASRMDTESERKYSTSQARKNRAGGAGSEYRKRKELQARDDAQADIKKYGLH